MGSVSMKSLAIHTLPSSGYVKTGMDVQPMASLQSLRSSAGPCTFIVGGGVLGSKPCARYILALRHILGPSVSYNSLNPQV